MGNAGPSWGGLDTGMADRDVIDHLNNEDIARLLADSSGEVRAEIAGKIAGSHANLNDVERRMADDIFRIMMRDAEVRVREALALQLKDNPLLPHDVAVALAHDVETVALPILQFSEVLSDQDLIDIIHTHNHLKSDAVARRSRVSSGVADALVETHDEGAVATLVANAGAEISEATLGRLVEEFSDSEAVSEPLALRNNLPVTVAERLMARVSEDIRQHLRSRKDIDPSLADILLVQARERAVLGLADADTDAVKLAGHLYRNGRLTPSIILRAVCMGDIAFFEAALAKLARIRVENARTLIHDAGNRGFAALYERAGLPQPLFAAMRAAVDLLRSMQYDGEARDRERFSRKMIERILTQYGDLGIRFENSDLEYLLARMGQLPSTVISE
jgi:uncharacterized protein (DUF2336 family)